MTISNSPYKLKPPTYRDTVILFKISMLFTYFSYTGRLLHTTLL